MSSKKRCLWVANKDREYIKYHDKEWGRKVHKDQKLFEMMTLEGAQAGLSWETILKKREGYRIAFKGFDIEKVSKLRDSYLEKQLLNPEIVRNRLKVYSVRKNAKVVLELKQEFGSFHRYLCSFTGKEPLITSPRKMEEIPSKTDLSDRISKDLKKRGMSFVGSTIIYAFLQAAGFVNDHSTDCFRHPNNLENV